MQKLCKSLSFGLIKTCQLKDLNWKPLDIIVDQTKETILLVISFILGIDLTSKSLLIFLLVSVKFVVIFIIFCKFAHQNNSNYILLLVIIYLYFAGARVDAITLFNYLGISILYNMLLKKLRSIIASSSTFIKAQASNCNLIGI